MKLSSSSRKIRKTTRTISLTTFALLLAAACANVAYGRGPNLDLSKAVIVHSSTCPKHAKAAHFLRHEIYRRTGITLALSDSIPSPDAPAVVIGAVDTFPASYKLPAGLSVPQKAEGYALWLDAASRPAPTVYILGRDDKGVLFAVARLIRLLYLASNHITIPSDLRIAAAPADSIRAQQLLCKTQSKDGFIDWKNPSHKQQYISDLVLFGTNGFEPRPADDVDDFLEDLGLDLFLVVSCQSIIDHNSLSDDQIGKLYTDLVGVDHFTTYGGDASGSRPPQEVFPLMERIVPLILQNHPHASWWYSNQCLGAHAVDHDDYIFNYIRTNQPTWLRGMVYGPWTKRGIREISADLPARYDIRHYPEICHVRWCQYPVPKWDRVWAQVWPRNQSIYAMPKMMAQIYSATRYGTVGFLPYNHTGCYNDLNKFIWSAMGWDPNAAVNDILYDYAKAFFAYDFTKNPDGDNAPASKDAIIDAGSRAVARALDLLEQNWTGPLANNTSAEPALKLWKKIAESMGGVGKNWRLEMFLYKAFLDAQVKRKYDAEIKCEQEAYDALKQAETLGVPAALRNARAALAQIDTQFQSKDAFRTELQSAGLTNRFGDLDTVLDNIYSPLNDRKWLESQFNTVTALADVKKILDYENPVPGGFYDNLGVPSQQPHLVRQKTWDQDPGFVYSPIEWLDYKPGSSLRHSQQTHAVSRYDTPLLMRWQGLDRRASYHISVVYLGPFSPQFTCKTDDGRLIHGPRGNSGSTPVSYPLPQASTSDGVLQLQWQITNQVRGASVTEIWLIKD